MEAMNDNEWAIKKSRFSALSTDQKAFFLSMLAHEITISARGAYPEQAENEEVIEKLMAFNELLHRITGQEAHILAGDEKRHPDEGFIDILLEKAQTEACESELAIAFDFALRHLLPNK